MSNGSEGDFGMSKWKVGHEHISNNIPQMRSAGFQAPFISGGNQVAYYLGSKGNTSTQPQSCSLGRYSSYKKVIKKH
jgi:hypothetical protein